MPIQHEPSFRFTSHEQSVAVQNDRSSIVVSSQNSIKMTSVQIHSLRNIAITKNESNITNKLGRNNLVSSSMF